MFTIKNTRHVQINIQPVSPLLIVYSASVNVALTDILILNCLYKKKKNIYIQKKYTRSRDLDSLFFFYLQDRAAFQYIDIPSAVMQADKGPG